MRRAVGRIRQAGAAARKNPARRSAHGTPRWSPPLTHGLSLALICDPGDRDHPTCAGRIPTAGLAGATLIASRLRRRRLNAGLRESSRRAPGKRLVSLNF
jgi:hypothetical protein